MNIDYQIHLSNYAHLNIKNINKVRDDINEGASGKPNGLWTSTYNRTGIISD